ncbi:MAG: adaptin [Halobacteriaceae archaeon]
MDENGSAGEQSPRSREEGSPERELTEGPPITVDSWDEAPEADTPEEYAREVAALAAEDPVAAGDRVGDLLDIARDHEGARDDVREALDVVGWRRPEEFEVWADSLAEAAGSPDDGLATIGMAALADLAATTPRAAAKGIDAALGRLAARSAELRRAALSVVAEVGPEDPDAVAGADRGVAAAIEDPDPAVRQAGVVAAGRLLASTPGTFPRTANALLGALDDDATVREYALVAAANFARTNPANVPEKRRVMAALAAADDDELGLRRGATDEAVSELLAVETGVDLPLGQTTSGPRGEGS